MFDIGVTEDKEKTTLHLSFDFLIADWASIWTLLIEFETIYYNKGNGDEKCAISFRNYVLNEMGMKNSSRYRRDKEYWKNRLDIIPEAPVLPMRSNAEKSNKFIRMARKLSAEDWEKIKFFSSQNSVTPTATVLSIFALCIERWSVNKKFSLNLTTLIRNNKYTGIYNTIGDFTSVDVLEIDLSEKIIFADFVKNVNKQIFEDLDHSSYSGIEVIRDLRKRRKNPMLFFPIIFTSSIGLIKNDGMVGKVNNNGISQTPQAFLDCQVIAKIKCLIGEKEETHKYREKYKWIDKDSVILKKSYDEIVNDNFDDVAYVIFTSGSTGEPILLLVKIFEECARKQESRKVVFLTHFLICLPWLVFLKLEAKYIIRIVWILLDIQSNWKKCIGTKVQKMKRLYFGLV